MGFGSLTHHASPIRLRQAFHVIDSQAGAARVESLTALHTNRTHSLSNNRVMESVRQLQSELKLTSWNTRINACDRPEQAAIRRKTIWPQ